jgi:hypothetical protein
MKVTKLILFTLLGISVGLMSCKKTEEPPVGTCSDGYMNNGELGVDCGGPCPPCDQYEDPVFFAAFNAELVMFGNPTALYGDTIYLGASNDSIQVSLRFKNLTEADESGQFWPYLQDGLAYVTYNGVNYTQLDNVYSTVIITQNQSSRISGLFQLYLPHGVDNLDTLKVVNGTFNNIPY